MINDNKKAIDFLQNIINDIKSMHNNGLYYLSFVIMVSAVETLGAFIDKKPLRARAQSFKRFNLAIDKLFPLKYHIVNKNSFLYDKLRNHFAHNLLPSSYLILIDKETDNQKHLDFKDEKLIVAADIFYADLKLASKKVINKIKNDELKNIKLY